MPYVPASPELPVLWELTPVPPRPRWTPVPCRETINILFSAESKYLLEIKTIFSDFVYQSVAAAIMEADGIQEC